MKLNVLLYLSLVAMSPLFGGGKNKYTPENFEWKLYETEHFKIFYYESESHLLEKVADFAETGYTEVSGKLQHQLNFKVPFIFYKTHEEFSRTNIFPGFVPKQVAAFADPFQSRMVMPVDSSDKELYDNITHELTHVFQYSMLYNNRIKTIIQAQPPQWFIEGMASYVADDEDNMGRMVLRDTAIYTNFGSLGSLISNGFVAYRVGHAAFDYMEENWGIEGVRNFLWQYRKNIRGNVTAAIERAFDIDIQEFDRGFKKYLRRRYIEDLVKKEEPDDHAKEIITAKVFTTLAAELSPSGDLFAAVVPVKNELDLVLISTKDGRIFKNLTKGYTNRYLDINLGTFNGKRDLAWNSNGNEIVFSASVQQGSKLFIVSVLNGDIVEEISFEDVRDPESPSFALDGQSLYFVANKGGQFDVFCYDRNSKTTTNITDDPELDSNPRISPDGKELIYSSLRDRFNKIVSLNLETGRKTQLTSGLGNDIQPSYSADMKSILFASDRYDDIYNIYELNLESGAMAQYTDILTGAFSPQERVVFDHREGKEDKKIIFTSYYQGRYRLYRMDKPAERAEAYDPINDNYSTYVDKSFTSNLKLNKDNYKKYQPFKNFSVSNLDVQVGSTDDGRFISDTVITLSDVLGNQSIDLYAQSVSSYESYYLNYLNRSKRLQWGSSFSLLETFFIIPDFSDLDPRITRGTRLEKYNYLTGYVRYPFSLFSRVDFTLGMADVDAFAFVRKDVPTEDGEVVNVLTLDFADYTEPFAQITLSHDTIRYAGFGPLQGMGVDLSYMNVLDKYDAYSFIFRAYKELTPRSVLAFRTVADQSEGDFPRLYYLGGTNLLRGDYRYRELFGTRRFLMQTELRFPFVDHLQFPGFAFRNIRGAFFVEAGGAWYDDDAFNFEFQPTDPDENQGGFDPDAPNPNYLIGSLGVEISMNLFGLDVHWTWAKRTNFDEIPSNSRFSFWIGRQF